MSSLQECTREVLESILENEHKFSTTRYAHRDINYKKGTMVKIIEVFRRLEIRKMKPATKFDGTKAEIARQLKFAYGIEFTPHEINYIPRKEFIVLFNTLIEP